MNTLRWLKTFETRYGYKKTFKARVYKTSWGQRDHEELFSLKIHQGQHPRKLDAQRVELHMPRTKCHLGINHPIGWLYRNGVYVMVKKDDWTVAENQEELEMFMVLCFQELVTRGYNLKRYQPECPRHRKAFIKTLFVLKNILSKIKDVNDSSNILTGYNPHE